MVFVDKNMACIPNRKWRWATVCHLWCDGDLEELHAFAQGIGLKRSWFQPRDGDIKHRGLEPWQRAHYDLTPGMRQKALQAGASEATREDTIRWLGRTDLLKGENRPADRT